MVTGTVKWFNSKKGYGFIGSEEGADLFVHLRGIDSKENGLLVQGDVVEFEVTKGPKGDSASNVKVLQRTQQDDKRERQAPRGPSLEDQLKNLRKTSKEKQSDLNNRLKRY